MGISYFDNSVFVNNGGITLEGSSPSYTVNATVKIDIDTTYTILCKNTAGTVLSSEDEPGKAGETVTPPVPAFAGYTLSSKDPASGSLVLKYSGNIITFIYEPIPYGIEYELNGGTNAPTNPGTYDATMLPLTLADPTRTDYTFAGWSDDGIIPVDSTGDKTFTASWEPITYSVSYLPNDGTGSVPSDPGAYAKNSAVTVLFSPLPTRTGYDFLGWSTSSSATTAQYSSSGTTSFTMGTEDVTLHAVWALHGYSVSYSANEGEGSVPSNSNTFVMESTVPVQFSPLPTRTGYDFAGWATSASATIAEYTSGGAASSFTMGTEDVTLYAVWTLHGYSVSYSANEGGGSVPNDSNTYVMDGVVPVLFDPLPTRTGYDFKGWAASASASEADYTSGGSDTFYMGTGDVTLYAVWSLNHYSISYVLNDSVSFPANNASNPTSYTVLSDTIHLANPTRTGYTFDHWDPAGTIAHGSTENKTFTAFWTANTYNITYVLNNGTNDANNPKTYTADSATINLAPATRLGYNFLGWYVGKTLTSSIPAGSTGDKTFTAKWSAAIWYDITYTMNGGANDWLNPTRYNVTSDTITLRDPARLGYNFTGWTPEGTIPTGSTGDKSFTAGWSPKQYDISYELFGGTNAETNPSSYTIESPTIHLANPTRPGYNFLFWFFSDGTIEHGSHGNRIFVAVWSLAIRYNITYNLGGGTNPSSNPAHYWVVSPTITLANPTRTGYTFAGWSPSGSIPTGSTGNRTFTANWTPIVYKITYTLGEGGAATGNPTEYTIETPTFTLNAPTREHYTFDGWTPTDSTIEQGSTGDRAFTAKWTTDAYQITYHLGGGSNSTHNPASYTVETETFTLSAPTRDYYTFAGWSPAETTIVKGSSGDRTFTASWTPISYSIAYDLAGGVVAGSNPVTYTVETPDFTLINPTRTGYDFLGWDPADSKVEKGSHGNLSFTALWSDPIEYKITYALAGGANAATNPAIYTVETETFTLSNPTRDYYTFAGWSPAETTIVKGSTGDRTFTASWTPILLQHRL